MAYKTVALLFLSALVALSTGSETGEVTERGVVVDFLDNPAAVFRYANFPSNIGHIQARQEDCGCQEKEKCCTSPEGATFCVPEGATCCGRTWCNGELEICCRNGPHGGCCPRDTMCATGGKGCCKKDRPCFGPFVCYDHSSVECTPGNTTVEAFQCCPGTAPWCLFDPENGYGCFVGKILPTYSKEFIGTPTDVAKVPTDTPTFGALTTPVSPTGTTVGTSKSNPVESVVTSESMSGSLSFWSETWKPSGSASSTMTAKTTTTKKNSTSMTAPTTTDSIGRAVAVTESGSYVLLGAAGLVLIMLG